MKQQVKFGLQPILLMSQRALRKIHTQIMMITIQMTLTKESFLLGSLHFLPRTSSHRKKSTISGLIKEECFNLQAFISEGLALTSLLRKGIGLAHINSGRIYFYHTILAKLTATFNTTMSQHGFGILIKMEFQAFMVQWQAQLRQTLKIQATSWQESKSLLSKRSSLINQ